MQGFVKDYLYMLEEHGQDVRNKPVTAVNRCLRRVGPVEVASSKRHLA